MRTDFLKGGLSQAPFFIKKYFKVDASKILMGYILNIGL